MIIILEPNDDIKSDLFCSMQKYLPENTNIIKSDYKINIYDLKDMLCDIK